MSALPPIVPTPKDDEEHKRQTKAAYDAMIEEERAAGEAARAMGPEPHPEITEEQLRNNPSNYVPAIDSFLAQSKEEMHVTVTQNPSVRVPDPVAVTEDSDTRQLWVCVMSDGIRSFDATGKLHPAFHSDAHKLDQMVRCPTCESVSVRKVLADEDLTESEKRAAWTRERTAQMR